MKFLHKIQTRFLADNEKKLEEVFGDLDARRASLSSNAIKRLSDKITTMSATISPMIEEEKEPETNRTTEGPLQW